MKPVELVVASSGKTSHTKDVVADVRTLKEKRPDWFNEIIQDYLNVVNNGRRALEALDFDLVGQLMNKNHHLLQQITVSNDLLDRMVDIARNAGALGSKLTGTGRGGNMISLTPGLILQEKVANALSEAGYRVWKTLIGI